jgi:aryl-alcohol dehydrogenase (NADP+)
MTFDLQCDEQRSHVILDTAANGGIDFIDTADVYPLGGDQGTEGRTEEMVGNWLKGKRRQFIVATKCVGV